MQGANEYCGIFKHKEQVGRLYLVPGSHARGPTFEIWVLKEDADGGDIKYRNGVEVYGVVSGQRGWTETYGWIHKGPWVEDFLQLAKKRKSDIEERNQNYNKAAQATKASKEKEIADFLSTY